MVKDRHALYSPTHELLITLHKLGEKHRSPPSLALSAGFNKVLMALVLNISFAAMSCNGVKEIKPPQP